jgi:hypothetical protein
MSYLKILNEELISLNESFDIVKLYEGKSPQEKSKNKSEFIKELDDMYDFLFIIVNNKIKKIKPKEISDNGLRQLYIYIKGHPKDIKKRDEFQKSMFGGRKKGRIINTAPYKSGFKDIEVKGNKYILYTSNAYYKSMDFGNFNSRHFKLGNHKSVKMPKSSYLYSLGRKDVSLFTKSIKVDTGIEKYDPKIKNRNLDILVSNVISYYTPKIATGDISSKFTVTIKIPIEFSTIINYFDLILEIETLSPKEILKVRSDIDKEIEDSKKQPISPISSKNVYPDDGRRNRYWGD